MHYQSLFSSCCLIGAGLVLCGQAHAADDATTAYNAAISAYGAAAATGDPAKMAAVYAPDGEVVSPYGFIAGHDALGKFYASFMKPGDKEVDTSTSARMIGDVALRRLYVHAGLGHILRERLLDEGRRQSGRRVEDSESDLYDRSASVDRAALGFVLERGGVCDVESDVKTPGRRPHALRRLATGRGAFGFRRARRPDSAPCRFNEDIL
jgi:SnoaL-like domain